MTGLWNPEGKGYERIPSAYGDFAISKKNEFFLGMLGSVLFAIVFTCFVALLFCFVVGAEVILFYQTS